MRNRFDRISKALLRDALAPSGTVSTELEVNTADTQAIDVWFEPDPEHEAERSRAGLLGRMGEGPTMFEPFHDTPGLDEMRACLRKQLTFDHARSLEARKRGEPRPPFPRCWVLSTGRPESVLAGYNLTPMPSWPAGFYESAPAEATGVVVLRELPRKRSTLLLRLMGAGTVLRAAIEDLKRLPARAWERKVALPTLLATRMEIPQTSTDASEQEFLMTTQNLYEQLVETSREQGRQQGQEEAQRRYERLIETSREQGRQQGRQEGRREGHQEAHKHTFALLYEARFGPLPAALREALEAMNDATTLERWLVLVGTRAEPEVVAAMRADSGASAR